jgi:hypothetical protein
MDEPVSCACGTATPDPLQAGWTHLQLTNGWRCGRCARELAEAGKWSGAPGDPDFRDPLPPDSIGALKRPSSDRTLAETILPPAVKP